MTGLLTAFGDAFAGAPLLALLAAFAWGVLSVLLSPCHLSSLPLVVAYVSGGESPPFSRALQLSSAFALGTLASIAGLGGATALAGRLAGDVGPLGNVVVALVFIVMGLNLLGVVPLPAGLSAGAAHGTRRGVGGALLLGGLFGLALGPCTFAFMAPLLGLAFRSARGVGLLLAYGLGHALFIALAGASLGTVQRLLKWNEQGRAARWLRHGSGVAVILGGLYFLWTAR